jgi:hypothetical protein
VLPVDLVSFTAQCSGKGANLYWSTATEFNNSHFTVERSKEGKDFEPVGTVPGAGNSNAIQNYAYEDPWEYIPGKKGIWYYRLKQTDYNGEYEYLPVSSVHYPCSDFGIIILPNPSTGIFSVSGLGSDSEIAVYNLLGEKVFNEKANSKFITIDISDKPKGVYLIKTFNNEGANFQKLILK